MGFISDPNSRDSNIRSIFRKGYIKIFSIAIIFLIVGVILISVTTLIDTFAEPNTSEESEILSKMLNTISAISTLSLQVGIILFSLSTFVGAITDKALSGEVRRGMILASGIAILALGIMLITIVVAYSWF